MSADLETTTPASGGSTTGTPILEAIHVRKYFPVHRGRLFSAPKAVHAMEDVTLSLRAGQAVAVVGESGSGKSTLARVLARLYPATAGELRYRGNTVDAKGKRGMRDYRQHVQMVFQDPFSSLNPVHRVRYHLSRPLHIHGHVSTKAEERRQLTELLERVSLYPAEQYIDKFPYELSGGQRQRVAIARALAAEPEVLLADEPVSMLDVSIRLDVLNLMLSLKNDLGLALLYITHDIASARYFAEETVVMYAGQMVEGGVSDAVIQTPKHPYTQLLLQAAPDPDRILTGQAENARLPARGEPPSLITPPTGCRFHPRCPFVMPICRERFPARTQFDDGHWTHCFLYGEHAEQPARASAQTPSRTPASAPPQLGAQQE